MTLHELYLAIEGDDFVSRLSPTDIPKRLVQFASEQPEMRELVSKLAKSEKTRVALIEHIHDIVSQQVDFRYRNPWDIPLACYLIAMYAANKELAKTVAAILRTSSNSWWVPRVSAYLDGLNVQGSENVYPLIQLGAAASFASASQAREMHSLQSVGGVPILSFSTAPQARGSADVHTRAPRPSELLDIDPARSGTARK